MNTPWVIMQSYLPYVRPRGLLPALLLLGLRKDLEALPTLSRFLPLPMSGIKGSTAASHQTNTFEGADRPRVCLTSDYIRYLGPVQPHKRMNNGRASRSPVSIYPVGTSHLDPRVRRRAQELDSRWNGQHTLHHSEKNYLCRLCTLANGLVACFITLGIALVTTRSESPGSGCHDRPR